jgi:predicted O-methyltransferase YrrM
MRAGLSHLETPILVRRALAAAERLGFSQSCSPEVGQLLRLMAGVHAEGQLLEIGTGAGVGAAWIATGMAPTCQLVTVEENLDRAQAAAAVFADVDTVEVVHGDWRQVDLPDQVRLMFIDARAGKWSEQRRLVERLAVGGMVVLDDLTPQGSGWQGDPVRDWWHGQPDLVTTELAVNPRESVLLALKRWPTTDPAGGSSG